MEVKGHRDTRAMYEKLKILGLIKKTTFSICVAGWYLAGDFCSVQYLCSCGSIELSKKWEYRRWGGWKVSVGWWCIVDFGRMKVKYGKFI